MSYSGHIPQEGVGVLFQNDEKKHPKAPDMSGQIMIDGKVVKLAAWTRSTSSGKTLISLKVDNWMPSKDAKRPYTREVKDDNDVPF